jgi:hypothetical protein
MLARQHWANDERRGQQRGRNIAFPELSNCPPLTRSCQDSDDENSLDSAPYAGPAIASCDGSRIDGDASTLLLFKLR